MKIEKAVGTIVMVTILVGVLLGGMDFAKFGVTLLAVTTAYLVLGMFMPGIPWVVFLDPWECAAVVFLGQPAGIEGPGGPVLLIPFVMWIREIVDLRDQSSPVGPFQATTGDFVEVAGLQGMVTHRIRRDPQGQVHRDDVERWAFGTSPTARRMLLRDLPEAVLRQRTGQHGLQKLLGSEVKLPTTDMDELAGRTGREVVALVQGPIDLPDEFRQIMGKQVSHTAEAAGLRVIKDVLVEAKEAGVDSVLADIRATLALAEIHEPIVITGSSRRGTEEDVAGLIAALKKELGGKQ